MNKPTVLIIDDESDLRESIADTLEYEGYELLFANNGKEGLIRLKEIMPTLVLLDLRMPEMDGLAVLKKLHVRPDDPYAIIVLTGHGDDEEIQQCFELGIHAFLRKPFNIFELQGLVKQSILLKQTLIALRQAEQAKSKFLSRMSHELRTPLHVILGFAQIQQTTIQEDASISEKEAVAYILSAGRHLLTLVNDILMIVGTEQQQTDIFLGDTQLNQVIEDSVSLVRSQAQKHSITIKSNPTTLHVKANDNRLKQVLMNVLSNAIKYNRTEGSITIAVNEVEPEQIEINIEDTGVGIEIKDQEEIFEPFTRLAYAEHQMIDGRGIGLTLTKFLVQQMNGHISLNSNVGIGTTFCLRFPKSDVTLIEPTTTASEGIDHTILCLDDNPVIKSLIEIYLRAYPNINLLTADTAEEGIEIAENNNLKLIFIGLNLPTIHGVEVINILKSNPKFNDTQMIALNADALPEHDRKIMTTVFDEYLTIPTDVHKIMQIIQQL